jgi:hypothetical protein
MSDYTFTTDIELEGRFFEVEVSYETEWEDDSFDHDWGGRTQTEVCGHWEACDAGILSVTERLANGDTADIPLDDPIIKALGAIASERADDDCSSRDIDPPERDCPDDDRDYD